MEEIRGEYRTKLASGEVDRETDAYGCNETFVTASGEVTTIGMAARDIVNTVDSAKTITNNSEDTSTTPLLLVDSSDCGVQKRRKGRRRQRRGGGGGQKRSHVTALGMHAALANEKRRPLLKGVKMIDKRTIQGKKSAAETVSLSARELAARAALARLGQNPPLAATAEIVWKTTETDFAARTFVGRNAEHKNDSHDEEDESNFEDSSGVEEENETIRSHVQECACRSCEWDRMLFIPTANG